MSAIRIRKPSPAGKRYKNSTKMEVWRNLWRKKVVESQDLSTELRRCLTTTDVAVLGLGHMIGGGIYVLTGQVAGRVAGPGIVISFFLAGVAAVLAALCYAELGARAPRAGSAYTFVFMSLGEFPAFLIGWQLIMEHLIGAAAVARTWSAYLDSLFGHRIVEWAESTVPLTKNQTKGASEILSPTVDFPALLITLSVAFFVAIGVKSSARFNNTATALNLAIIAIIICYGGTFADWSNWSTNFLPFGFDGVLSGASRCFFAYVGFDSIATAAEETTKPHRSLPIATLSAMFTVTVLYLLMSSVLTLMVPYQHIDSGAAFSSAFVYCGVPWASYLVAAGAVAGITTAVTGHLFTLPRCIYAMAEDGLLWRPLAYVLPDTKVPSYTVGLVAMIAGSMALILNTQLLVDLLSIGTLWAYTLVSCSLIKLRYIPSLEDESGGQLKDSLKFLVPNCAKLRSGILVTVALTSLLIFGAVASGCLIFGNLKSPGTATFFAVSIVVLVISFLVICAHKQNDSVGKNTFKVPCVPLLPFVSVLVNLLLMLSLPPITWTRLAVWLGVGLIIYFGYGHWNSSIREKADESAILLEEEIIYSKGN